MTGIWINAVLPAFFTSLFYGKKAGLKSFFTLLSAFELLGLPPNCPGMDYQRYWEFFFHFN
jgi:hypothetical protein